MKNKNFLRCTRLDVFECDTAKQKQKKSVKSANTGLKTSLLSSHDVKPYIEF